MAILYVYGTLRSGNTKVFHVPGTLFDLGWFPGVKLGGGDTVLCEKVSIKDLDRVDRYEGFRPDDPEGSLYIRKPYLDGWIYEYNQDVDPASKIPDGDWLAYAKQERGAYGNPENW